MSILDLAPGLHLGVPEAVYHEKVLGLASKGALDRVARSPAHYFEWVRGGEREETDPLRLGRATHCAMLEPARYDLEYIAEPEWGPCRANAELGVTTEQGRENKKRRDAWREQRAGLPTLTADEARMIRGMVSSVLAHPLARRLLESGVESSEATVRWTHPPSGLECKARLDSYAAPIDVAFDLKTTQDASPDGFARAVAKYGYHRQDAHYRDGMCEIGRTLKHFVFIAVEKEPPYAVAVHVLDDAAQDIGERQWHRQLMTLSGCLARGEWPSYPETINSLSLPRWAVTE